MTDQVHCGRVDSRNGKLIKCNPPCQKLRRRDSDNGCARISDYWDHDRSLFPDVLRGT